MDHPRSHRRGSWAAPLRATPGSPRAARCRAGPAHVEEMTAPVTPCRCSPGPTVRDACGRTRGSAAPIGDVPGTDEASVAPVPAVRAGEPASLRLWDGPVAFQAGGGRPPLVHEHHLDPRQLGLVGQAGKEMGAQGREFGHLGPVLFPEPAVPVDHPGPHVPGGAQQAVAAPALGRGGAQGDPGGAVDSKQNTCSQG